MWKRLRQWFGQPDSHTRDEGQPRIEPGLDAPLPVGQLDGPPTDLGELGDAYDSPLVSSSAVIDLPEAPPEDLDEADETATGRRKLDLPSGLAPLGDTLPEAKPISSSPVPPQAPLWPDDLWNSPIAAPEQPVPGQAQVLADAQTAVQQAADDEAAQVLQADTPAPDTKGDERVEPVLSDIAPVFEVAPPPLALPEITPQADPSERQEPDLHPMTAPPGTSRAEPGLDTGTPQAEQLAEWADSRLEPAMGNQTEPALDDALPAATPVDANAATATPVAATLAANAFAPAATPGLAHRPFRKPDAPVLAAAAQAPAEPVAPAIPVTAAPEPVQATLPQAEAKRDEQAEAAPMQTAAIEPEAAGAAATDLAPSTSSPRPRAEPSAMALAPSRPFAPPQHPFTPPLPPVAPFKPVSTPLPVTPPAPATPVPAVEPLPVTAAPPPIVEDEPVLVHVLATMRDASPPRFECLSQQHLRQGDAEMAEHMQGLMQYVQGRNPVEMSQRRHALWRHLQRVHHLWALSIMPAELDALGLWAGVVNAVVALPDGSVRDPKGYVIMAGPGGRDDTLARLPHPADALQRKQRTEALLLARGWSTPNSLPPVAGEGEIELREAVAVMGRALAVMLVAVRAESLAEGGSKVLTPEKLRHKLPAAFEHLSPHEQHFVDTEAPSESQVVAMGWRYEALNVLLWALGLVDELHWPGKVCDVAHCVSLLVNVNADPDALVQDSMLRSRSEILDQLDLHMRLHWLLRDAELHDKPGPDISRGVVMERHHALNWLIGFERAPWDKVSTAT